MGKKKLLVMVLLSVLVISTIGGVVAFPGYISRFEGPTHGACHHSSDTKQSENGALVLSITPNRDLDTLEEFVLTAVIHNFTEPNTYDDPYENITAVGLSGELGDNGLFLRHLNGTIVETYARVDATGYAATNGRSTQSPIEFDLRAPDTAGTYEIIVTAIAAANHSADEAYNITWASGSIFVDVVAAGDGDGGTIAGNILIITIGSVFAISTVLILKMKKRWRKKELYN